MNDEKITTRMGSTTVTQTAEGFELKNGSSIKTVSYTHLRAHET